MDRVEGGGRPREPLLLGIDVSRGFVVSLGCLLCALQEHFERFPILKYLGVRCLCVQAVCPAVLFVVFMAQPRLALPMRLLTPHHLNPGCTKTAQQSVLEQLACASYPSPRFLAVGRPCNSSFPCLEYDG